jgi:hypothetical protein
MSRGPGRWQRRILTALALKPAFYLRHLLPDRPTRAQQVALLRAAYRLQAQGRVVLTTWVSRPRDRGAVMVTKPGVSADSARMDRRLGSQWARDEILSVIERGKIPLDNT